jgi:hypothetical protein
MLVESSVESWYQLGRSFSSGAPVSSPLLSASPALGPGVGGVLGVAGLLERPLSALPWPPALSRAGLAALFPALSVLWRSPPQLVHKRVSTSAGKKRGGVGRHLMLNLLVSELA